MRACSRTLPTLALALAIGFVIGLPADGEAEDAEAKPSPVGTRNYHLRAIEATGVSADGKGALRLLRSLLPRDENKAEIARLIELLGDDAFPKREAAEAGLMRIGVQAVPALQAAKELKQLETAARAGRLIARIKRQVENFTPAIVGAFGLIGRDRPAGGVAAILDALPMLDNAWAASQGSKLITRIATAADRKPLLAVLENAAPETVHIAAIEALAAISKGDELAGLERYMAATQPEAVQLAAARALGNRGHRPALAALVRLLESKDGTTRWKAMNLIKSLSGEEFEGEPSLEKLPAGSLRPIKEWLREKGPTAELHLPSEDVAEQ